MAAQFLLRLRAIGTTNENAQIVDLAGHSLTISNSIYAETQYPDAFPTNVFDNYIVIPSNTTIKSNLSGKLLKTEPYTVCFWFTPTQINSNTNYPVEFDGSGYAYSIAFRAKLGMKTGNAGNDPTFVGPNLAAYQLYHVALVNNPSIDKLKIYIDGTVVGTWNSFDIPLTNVMVGVTGTRPAFAIQDVCIIKGKAVWTSNFTPPSNFLSKGKVLDLKEVYNNISIYE